MSDETDTAVASKAETEAAESEADTTGIQPATLNVPVRVSVVLGQTEMTLKQLTELSRGAVVPLDRLRGDLVDVYANDRLVARGQLEITDEQEGRMGVKLTEIVRSTDG